MKQQFNKIPVAYVVNTRHESIQNMFTGRTKIEAVPDGIQHIFEVLLPGTMDESLSARSFCGLAKGDIGELAKEYKNRQPGEVCKDCAAAWKADPRSPWAAFAEGRKLA
jgi:hypothetical protein